MPYEMQEATANLKDENKFYYGDLWEAFEEDGNFGRQLKWVIYIDGDTWTNDEGEEEQRETWTWCSTKLTASERSKFRKYAKGLLGKEPVPGEMFDERHYTKKWYEDNPDADPEALTGRKDPWRVAVMFEHKPKNDGTITDSVSFLASEAATKS